MASAVVLIACGGGGGGGTATGSEPAADLVYAAGIYPPSSQFQNQCAAPRTGTDPNTGFAYADQIGSTLAEQLWLRSWTNELYLWYSEVPDTDPAGYTTAGYFDLLKTSALTPSGNPKDRFHFTYPTSVWETLSQSGVQTGYGVEWALIAAKPPRKALVAFTEAGSPAAALDITRGAQLLSVDGVDLATGNADTLNAGMFPHSAGESHRFVILDPGGLESRSVTMVSQNIARTPVQNVMTVTSNGGVVGYLLFNEHIATAESELIAAVNQLKAASISDLVLDIRYNGGGYLEIASELAYMIAGAARSDGRVFDRVQFNGKYTSTDPVTGRALAAMPFLNRSQDFSVSRGQVLPTLDLARLYVLTSAGTCSASEAIINGLRGIGVQVIQIGSTTCGKPYGFYPQDNCGTSYFSIEFKGVNDAGFGDYTDGFSPNNTAADAGALLPGCLVNDDFTHALGDPREQLFATALNYRMTATCPAAAGFAPLAMATTLDRTASAEPSALPALGGAIAKPPLRENRWYRWQQHAHIQ